MDHNTPRVSIGMPVYNGERFIREGIESILRQTFQDFELIISDNGSTDKTGQICREYAARDPRIRYYRNNKNRGAAWNHNRVFELASGEYFKWQCYDDLCDPQFLEKCVAVLDREPSVVLCYSKFVRIDEHGKRLGIKSSRVRGTAKPHERFRSLIHRRDSCEEIYGVTRADVLKKTRLIGSYSNSDDNLLADLILHGRFYEVPEPLFLYRLHPGMSTSAYPNRLDRMAWFDSSTANRISVPFCRVFWAYLSAIRRSPLPWAERLRCYLQVCGWLWEFRWWLREDFGSATSRIFHGILAPFLKRHAPWTRPIWHKIKRATSWVSTKERMIKKKRTRGRAEEKWEVGQNE